MAHECYGSEGTVLSKRLKTGRAGRKPEPPDPHMLHLFSKKLGLAQNYSRLICVQFNIIPVLVGPSGEEKRNCNEKDRNWALRILGGRVKRVTLIVSILD